MLSSLNLSTHQHTERRPRYISAEHAAVRFVMQKQRLAGAKAIDLTKPLVQSSPNPGGMHGHGVDELRDLRRAFDAACDKTAPERARAWYLVRTEELSQRDAATELRVCQATVSKYLAHVDRLVEQELADRELMVRSQAHPDKAPYNFDEDDEGDDDEDDEGEPISTVTGPKQRTRTIYLEAEDEAL